MRVVMLKRPGKHCNYFRDQDLETSINLSPAVMRSCHRAEGSTQGDLIARALCALNIWPLIRSVQVVSTAKQYSFADDAVAQAPLQKSRDSETF